VSKGNEPVNDGRQMRRWQSAWCVRHSRKRWREIDLTMQSEGHRVKVKIAQQLRSQTPRSRQWIADRLRVGSASYVSNRLGSVDSKL
jgi:hypothetical protein